MASRQTIIIMILILDGSSEHGAHIWSKSGSSICYRHMDASNPNMFHTCAICSELPYYISTMRVQAREVSENKYKLSIMRTQIRIEEEQKKKDMYR